MKHININIEEIYKKFPCKMLARDLNESKGKYKKLHFVPCAGDLANNCYTRYTKSGYVLYKKNGYLQPVCVVCNNKTKYIREQIKPYIDTIIDYLNNN